MQFNYTSKVLTNRLNAQNALSNRSISKLSSGKQINTSADNAAGMSISQKMKSMIRGLAMADRNIQDGLNLVNVADQALGTIADPLLIRLKQLSVQVSNDTLNNEDRMMIQDEIDSILKDIDTIANSTEFNGIYLLNGAKPGDTEYGQTNIEEFNYKDVLKSPDVSSNGKLDLRTDKGYPTTSADDNQILVFGSGGTSYPSVQIGDKNYFLNGGSSSSAVKIDSCRVENDSYITQYTIEDGEGINVTVSQIVTIDKDKYDIKYEMKNNTGLNLPIGFRFNLDTDIEGDDSAKFIVEGAELTQEAKYEGGSIPGEFTVYNKTGTSNKIQAFG